MISKSARSIEIYKRRIRDLFSLFIALGTGVVCLAYLTLFRESSLLSLQSFFAIGVLAGSLIFVVFRANGLLCTSCGKKIKKKDRILIPDEEMIHGKHYCYPWDIFECPRCGAEFRVRAIGEYRLISKEGYEKV